MDCCDALIFFNPNRHDPALPSARIPRRAAPARYAAPVHELAAHRDAGDHSSVPGDIFKSHAAQHLPVLSILLALWLPGRLQARRFQGRLDGYLAGFAL